MAKEVVLIEGVLEGLLEKVEPSVIATAFSNVFNHNDGHLRHLVQEDFDALERNLKSMVKIISGE